MQEFELLPVLPHVQVPALGVSPSPRAVQDGERLCPAIVLSACIIAILCDEL